MTVLLSLLNVSIAIAFANFSGTNKTAPVKSTNALENFPTRLKMKEGISKNALTLSP